MFPSHSYAVLVMFGELTCFCGEGAAFRHWFAMYTCILCVLGICCSGQGSDTFKRNVHIYATFVHSLFAMLMMLTGLASLGGQALHSATDMLCVLCMLCISCLGLCSYSFSHVCHICAAFPLLFLPCLVIHGRLAGLCHGPLHWGIDLLCVYCARFCCLEQYPYTLTMLLYIYNTFLLSYYHFVVIDGGCSDLCREALQSGCERLCVLCVLGICV